MIEKVGDYLETASAEKKLERNAPWNGLGARFITLKMRTYLYLALVVLGFGFGVAAAM